MDLNLKKDEKFTDGHDKWTIHYSTSNDTRVDPGDYKEVVQVSKNGNVMGQTTWHKDKNGNDKSKPYEEGVTQVPSTARKVTK
jgi:hypothetical protein